MIDNNSKLLSKMSNAIRFLSADAVQKAKSGHPGMPMGMSDVSTVLFKYFFDSYIKEPNWTNRDRFILSAGHGSMLLYSILYLIGSEDITIEDIKQFRQLHSKTAGHPEYGVMSGIETTTGPLGQGFANAVGMAIAERIMQERFGEKITNHQTYVIAGDGCLMEGISHEAASLAGHLNLKKLIVFFDDNKISIDGSTKLTNSDDHLMRFTSYGWNTTRIDGHNFKQIYDAIKNAKRSDKPSFIACKTTIAKGSPNKAGSEKSHGAPLGEEEIQSTRNAMEWDYEPFIIPNDILEAWRSIGLRCESKFKKWTELYNQMSAKKEFDALINGNWSYDFASLKNRFMILMDQKLHVFRQVILLPD